MVFANIEYLFLLLLLVPYIVWYIMKRKKTEPTLLMHEYMRMPLKVTRIICFMYRLVCVSSL